MQIFVKYRSNALSMDVSPDLAVTDFKQQIFDNVTKQTGKEPQDPEHIELLSKGNVLEEEKSLRENGISPGDMLELYDPIEAD